MKQRQNLTGLFAFLGLLVMILDGKTALTGAQLGLELCLRTVIPSLFPFFVLSNLVTGTFSSQGIPFLRPLGKRMGIPEGMESILIPAFLGGYPVGAQCVSQAWKYGQLSKTDAEAMLAFSSNAGPAFLFGMVALQFPDRHAIWMLWGVHILGAVFAAILLKRDKRIRKMETKDTTASLTQSLYTSVKVMANVCGWVIFFRVFLQFINRWILWILPIEVRIAVTGLLELSNGCCELAGIENQNLRFLVCAMILGFGGICVAMQTGSVTKGLSLRFYYLGKLLQTLFSLCLSMGLVLENWLPIMLLLGISSLFLWNQQKKSSIQVVVGV